MKCVKCGKCCNYICLQLNTPKTKNDIDNIRWYLAHKKIRIFIGFKKDWNMQVLTRCEYLNKDNLCKSYIKGNEQRRPKICQNYSSKKCHNTGPDGDEKYSFNKLEDLDFFLNYYNPFTLKKLKLKKLNIKNKKR